LSESAGSHDELLSEEQVSDEVTLAEDAEPLEVSEVSVETGEAEAE
jgi:hypothetical protein